MMFRLRGHFRELTGIQVCASLGMQMHHANGKRQQRKLLPHPLAIRRNKTSRLKVFGAIEASALALKVIKQLIETFAPVFRAKDQKEVVAANMANEVAGRVDPFIQALRQTQQNFITPSVAVDIVKGFELSLIHI